MPLSGRLGAFCRFALERAADVSGVSGTGTIAVGVQFPNGRCVLQWAEQPDGADDGFCSHRDVAAVLRTHGHAGQTTLRWLEGPPDA